MLRRSYLISTSSPVMQRASCTACFNLISIPSSGLQQGRRHIGTSTTSSFSSVGPFAATTPLLRMIHTKAEHPGPSPAAAARVREIMGETKKPEPRFTNTTIGLAVMILIGVAGIAYELYNAPERKRYYGPTRPGQLLAPFREHHPNVTGLPASWDEQRPLKEWEGVELSETGAVIRVNLSKKGLRGQVDFTQFPASLESLDLSFNDLYGRADLTQLPAELRALDLSQDRRSPMKIHGTIFSNRLPRKLEDLYLVNQEFAGEIDSADLPPRLRTLQLQDNKLSGMIDFTKFPATMEEIVLGGNQIQCPIDLTALPPNLKRLSLERNKIRQRNITLENLPRGLEELELAKNEIGPGMLDFQHAPKSLQMVSINGNNNPVAVNAGYIKNFYN